MSAPTSCATPQWSCDKQHTRLWGQFFAFRHALRTARPLAQQSTDPPRADTAGSTSEGSCRCGAGEAQKRRPPLTRTYVCAKMRNRRLKIAAISKSLTQIPVSVQVAARTLRPPRNAPVDHTRVVDVPHSQQTRFHAQPQCKCERAVPFTRAPPQSRPSCRGRSDCPARCAGPRWGRSGA